MLTDLRSLTLEQLHALKPMVGGARRETVERLIAERTGSVRAPRYRPSQTPPELRTEKDVEQDIDAELERLGFEITRLSQARASRQTPGVPDRYARHEARKLRLWIEVKQPGGTVSPEQKRWHKAERDAGGQVITVWSLRDLHDELRARGFEV